MLQKLRSVFHRSSVSLQILSDLHLEINQQYHSYDFPVCAKNLVLAGDVGRLIDYDNYRDFLKQQTDRFELVYLVLGNHEFYGDTHPAGLEKARQLEKEPRMRGRLTLLHQRRCTIPGTDVTVLGCTLWSQVPDDAKDIVQFKIQDFKKIEDWTVDDHNAAHASDRDWLFNELQSIQTEGETQKNHQRILIITHHAPLLRGTSSPQHENNPWRSAFGTDVLPRAPNSANIKAWVYGHTHYTTEFESNGIRVVSNQRGYVFPWTKTTKSKDGFDEEKVLRL